MRVLFIHSLSWWFKKANKPVDEMMNIQLGISYLSSFLKSKGHVTDLMLLTTETQNENIDACIVDFNPQLICFTSVFTEHDPIKNVAGRVKQKYPSIFLIAGGSEASLEPEKVIRDAFDAICIGEGEDSLLELVSRLEKNEALTGIKGLWMKHGETIERNPTPPFIQDLDTLPFPDRQMWQKWGNDGANSKQVILLARGCPFLCTYCANHALRKLADGKYVRFRSVDNVIKEVRTIVAEFPETKEIYFEVETVGADCNFAIALCKSLEEVNKEFSNRITYGVNLRITPGKEYTEMFTAFKKANFRFVNIGLESGSMKIRTQVLKRNYSNVDIIRTVNTAKKCDLRIHVNVLIGLPDETPEDFNETVQCLRECLPDESRLSIFFPYPGTELYTVCKEKNLLKGLDGSLERRKAVLDLPTFPRKKIQKEYNWFYYNVYKGHRPIHQLLYGVLQQKISSHDVLYSWTRFIRDTQTFRTLKTVFV